MALADYFHRSAVAASQAIRGWDEEAIAERLHGVAVGVHWGDDVIASREGSALLDMSVRLLARLYPRLHLSGPSASRADHSRLALEINPSLELSSDPSHVIAIGSAMPPSAAQLIYAGCDGWLAMLSTSRPQAVGNGNLVVGAGAAAALAAANLFRWVFLEEPDLDTEIQFSTYDGTGAVPVTAGSPPGEIILSEGTVLVGLGAVGQAAAWTIGRSGVTGDIHLVDPEDIELGNLQRYVLARRSDEHTSKVALAASFLQDRLKVHQHGCSWAEFLNRHGFTWDSVAVAVDSRQDRRAVQASLPRWIVNAWTQPGDLAVSVHPWGAGACLACLYQPSGMRLSEDRLVAYALGLPQEFDLQVRQLLHTGTPPPPELLDEVAQRRQIDRALLQPFELSPLRTLYAEGICGGAVLPLNYVTDTPSELHVPLAHQSAMAGVLLGAQLMRAALGDGVRSAVVTRLDLLRSMPPERTQPAAKSPAGSCICQDPVYQRVYDEKYIRGASAPAGGRRQVRLPM